MLINAKTPEPSGNGQVLNTLDMKFKASPNRLLVWDNSKAYLMKKDTSGSTLSPFATGICATAELDYQFFTFDISKNNNIVVNVANNNFSDKDRRALMVGSVDYLQASAFCFKPINTDFIAIDISTDYSAYGISANGFSNPQVDGNTVVFAKTIVENNNSKGALYSSIVTQTGQQLNKLIDYKTLIPGGTGTFEFDRSELNFSLSGNKVVIQQNRGLYLIPTTGGSVTKIIAVGDILDGDKKVQGLDMTEDSLSGNHLVFNLVYIDKSGDQETAIYMATFPSDIDPQNCLMNWVEATYPTLFSPAASTQTLAPYTYRYYKNPNAYLGISSADNHVYYLGADGGLKDAGDLVGWLAKANCQ